VSSLSWCVCGFMCCFDVLFCVVLMCCFDVLFWCVVLMCCFDKSFITLSILLIRSVKKKIWKGENLVVQ